MSCAGLALAGVLVLALLVGAQWWGGEGADRPADRSVSTRRLVGGPRRARRPAARASSSRTSCAGRAARAASLAGDDPAAERELRELTAAVRQVGLTTLDLRYVAAAPDRQDEVGARCWGTTTSWPRWSSRGSCAGSTRCRPRWRCRSCCATTASGPGSSRPADQPADRAPIWFNDRVTVERPSSRVMLVQSDAASAHARSDAVVGSGVRTVRDALPGWDGRVVVEVPGSPERFARATGLASSSARGIAAVTTSSAVADLDGGPERVVVNARVYAPLGGVGQRIVMAHELTHVAVGAASSAMPLWLSEGYADYVALRRSDVSVRVLAAQIRSLVRREGPPRALPGPDEFDGGNADVGAWYEASWLAARLIAATYGEDALDDFYRRADADGGTDRAFRELGTTERAFTAAVARRAGDARPVRRDPRSDLGRDQRLPARGWAGSRRWCASCATDLPPDQVVVHTSSTPGDRAFDAELPYPVVRDPARMLLPTPGVRDRVLETFDRYGCDRVVFGASAPLGLLGAGAASCGGRARPGADARPRGLVGLVAGHPAADASHRRRSGRPDLRE